ncbi:MAG TPA: hypothetical protein VJS66_00900 [Burkholderiales bacterium]|nr:hypothetical protein [Burkholderiales bacterium]
MRVDADERLWRNWPGSASPGNARAFGTRAQDLNVDFALPRADVVSALLQGSLYRDDGSWDGDSWSWTLAQRLQGLLAIALASGVAPLALVHACDVCAEMIEIGLDAHDFVRAEDVVDFQWSPAPDRTLNVMLPRGHEQRRWSQVDALTPQAMARELISGQSSDAEFPSAWYDALARELEQRDPLTALELETECPSCATNVRIPFDLEATLLAQLQSRQRRLLSDIHRLASAYHWSEAAILELPAWRRRAYLAQLGVAGHA